MGRVPGSIRKERWMLLNSLDSAKAGRWEDGQLCEGHSSFGNYMTERERKRECECVCVCFAQSVRRCRDIHHEEGEWLKKVDLGFLPLRS